MALEPTQLITLAASGFLGGVVRSLVGIIKNQTVYQDEFHFSWTKLTFTIAASGVIGLAAGLLITDIDFRLSLLAGYAGTDLLESVYKIRTAQGTLQT